MHTRPPAWWSLHHFELHMYTLCVCVCANVCVLQVKEAAFLGHGLDQCWLIYHLLMMYICKWLRAKKNLQKLNTHGGHRYILRQQYFCLLRSPVVANYVHKSQYIDMNNSLSWSYLLKWSPIHAIFTAHTISFPSYFLPQPLSLSLVSPYPRRLSTQYLPTLLFLARSLGLLPLHIRPCTHKSTWHCICSVGHGKYFISLPFFVSRRKNTSGHMTSFLCHERM